MSCKGVAPFPPLAILNTCTPGAWKEVGGIPLVARSLFHLRALGVTRVILLWDAGHPVASLDKWRGGIQLEAREVTDGLAAALRSIAALDDCFLYVDASHLIDPRLFQALLSASRPTLCHKDAADREERTIRAGLLHKEDLVLWANRGASVVAGRAASLLPGDIDPFRPEVRGPQTPCFLEIRTENEALQATHLIIRQQQKQVMDFPASYIHPPFENALTFSLLKTPVSPNGVTLMVAVLAFLVTWLFWYGHFVAGAVLALVVSILDGVDGKLARTKLQFSRLGEHEDVIDYFYENSWYLALGVSLSSLTVSHFPLFCAAALVIADTADNIFYTLAGKWYGKSIDLFSRFDRSFRCVAGRRNIYATLFLVGFPLGYPSQTFVAATFWAVATATIHGFRLRWYGRARNRKPVEGKESF